MKFGIGAAGLLQLWASSLFAEAALSPALRPQGLLTVRSLRVANTAPEGSQLYFGENREFTVGSDTLGNFLVKSSTNTQPMMMLDAQDNLHLNAPQINAMSVNSAGGFALRGVQQWQLVYVEDFSSSPSGWSLAQVSSCAGVHMLGGHCHFSRSEANKTFTGLPPHKQLRIVATYHFIDSWLGESGYMKLNIGQDGAPVVVWSEQHAQQKSKNGISLCGQESTAEGKFAVPIDIVVPHTQDSVFVDFGSTMEDTDPCDESWGVSGLEVHVRG
mmetsp:Transcript_3750/g.6307  ORF Transcript_3750/g.6307 Transcript_3750/m.6307 type:complete len:272 (+) Transcript_3750:130-945(+)